jgi:hypothetical protein
MDGRSAGTPVPGAQEFTDLGAAEHGARTEYSDRLGEVLSAGPELADSGALDPEQFGRLGVAHQVVA